MIYQLNIIVLTIMILFSGFFFVHYVNINKKKIFFLVESCEEGFLCPEFYMSGPPAPLSEAFTSAIRDLYLIEPPQDPDRSKFDLEIPVWRKLVEWNLVQETLVEIFKDWSPGFFVEVGAVDGNFMSQTLYLEKNYGWKGLLVEPDPRAFKELVKMKRDAWLSPLCIKYGYPSMKKYWIRRLEDNLPYHFFQLLMARSKLDEEILEGDQEKGSSLWIPCTPLSSILKAINITEVDFLSMNSGAGNDAPKIKDVLSNRKLTTKVLLLYFNSIQLYPNPFPEVANYIIDATRSKLLVKIFYKKSLCKLKSSTDCHTITTYKMTKACYTYLCFEHLKVITVK